MTEAVAVFQFIFPAVVIAMATVLLCFYLHWRKKRGGYDITIPMEVHTIPPSETQAQVDAHQDRFIPFYSAVDPPPPYTLFDPKRLTNIRPDTPPPEYEMYPIMLPLTAQCCTTPSELPTPPSSPSNHNHPHPQR